MAEDYPVIVVGRVDEYGNRFPTSQGGLLLTVSAVGDSVACADNDGDEEAYWTGTSFGMSRANAPSSFIRI
jgi:hypothetical protein